MKFAFVFVVVLSSIQSILAIDPPHSDDVRTKCAWKTYHNRKGSGGIRYYSPRIFNTIGGTRYFGPRIPMDCLRACNRLGNCKGFDWDYKDWTYGPCWIHTASTVDNTERHETSVHYKLRCDCTMSKYRKQNAEGGIRYYYPRSPGECGVVCSQQRLDCLGFDWNMDYWTLGACWIHLENTVDNVRDHASADHYRFRCPTV